MLKALMKTRLLALWNSIFRRHEKGSGNAILHENRIGCCNIPPCELYFHWQYVLLFAKLFDRKRSHLDVFCVGRLVLHWHQRR